MKRYAYYEKLKALARQIRNEHGLNTPRVLRSDLRGIYRAYGITIDLWPHKFKQLRGAYFFDSIGPTVMLARYLPNEPLIFTMAHELKHHLTDRDSVLLYCGMSNENEVLEIGAEIFAAELIFPEQEFVDYLKQMGIDVNKCTPEVLVSLKRETKTTLSYAGLAKRAEQLGFAPRDSLAKIKWKKLEEKIYGEPLYKRILRNRRRYSSRF